MLNPLIYPQVLTSDTSQYFGRLELKIKTLSELIATDEKWWETLDTPSVVIDLDVVESNLMRGAKFAESSGLNFRPHIKTHKIPQLAKAQLELGAVGITAQKTSEAEVMVDAGVTDVLISFDIVGPRKIERLSRLFCQRRRKNLPLGRSKRRPHDAAPWGVMPSSSKHLPRRVGR